VRRQGGTTVVAIGRVWFAPTDTVSITTRPGTSGALTRRAGAITSLSVKTAADPVTTLHQSPDGLDVDPEQEKNGPGFVSMSETPGRGVGGALAGLEIEKAVFTDAVQSRGPPVRFSILGGFRSGARVTDLSTAQGNEIAFEAAMGPGLADNSVSIGSDGTTVARAGRSMLPQGMTQAFRLGNAFDFGYQRSFDFVRGAAGAGNRGLIRRDASLLPGRPPE
jgi:hypothetical protein